MTASTRKTYTTVQARYINFCSKFKYVPYPVNEDLLCKFSSYLADEGLAPSSIRAYLSAVRFNQMNGGYADPNISAMSKLRQVQHGIKLIDTQSVRQRRDRLPITPEILSRMKKCWPMTSVNETMVWAVCLVAFFGFFRAGELTVPAECALDSKIHLTVTDVSFDSRCEPKLCCIRLKTSKTDPLRKGVDVFVGATGKDLCPVRAMVHYLSLRGTTPGFLFRYMNGKPLTKDKLVSKMRAILTNAGIDSSKYAGHSFRIGAATTAASRGLPDSTIKMLGRWKSDAYTAYVRTSREQLAMYSSRLVD